MTPIKGHLALVLKVKWQNVINAMQAARASIQQAVELPGQQERTAVGKEMPTPCGVDAKAFGPIHLLKELRLIHILRDQLAVNS